MKLQVILKKVSVVVITTAQLHLIKPQFRFSAGSNPARSVSEIRDGEDLWQWSSLNVKLNAFRRSTIPQKQFIIIIIIQQKQNVIKWHGEKHSMPVINRCMEKPHRKARSDNNKTDNSKYNFGAVCLTAACHPYLI